MNKLHWNEGQIIQISKVSKTSSNSSEEEEEDALQKEQQQKDNQSQSQANSIKKKNVSSLLHTLFIYVEYLFKDCIV